MENELSKLSQNKSQNIEGWTVRLTAKGYYNLCKSFGGKVESIYIGKVLDQNKARKKIAEKLSKLGHKSKLR
jgi:hypothetical protein